MCQSSIYLFIHLSVYLSVLSIWVNHNNSSTEMLAILVKVTPIVTMISGNQMNESTPVDTKPEQYEDVKCGFSVSVTGGHVAEKRHKCSIRPSRP